ncbi:unnamed protein product [Microthlaspi erraticum]|uniref:KIB1-4 beta-propeller domain-containing protein n=1 Tax=Microthlaspi erraticum TaxID=1685480 RepID=A0A6D2IWN8_9BRAS|nr:unnamed protein product [Microthlaspi erraticum]
MMMLDSSCRSDCVSKLHKSPSTLSKPDWTQLPQELLQVISEKLENCFDVVHARSVCSAWRSTFPFPCSLLRPSYSLPSFAEFPYESEDLCTLKKIPLFLLRVQPRDPGTSASQYFIGGIGRKDEPEDHIELPPPLQCSVKIPGSFEPTLMNMLDFQIILLGHQYRITGPNPKDYRGVAFLPLNKDRGGEFIVLLNYTNDLLVLRSLEMRWMWLKNISDASCSELVTFRGRFYAVFLDGKIIVFDPYPLKATPMFRPSELPNCGSSVFLVPSGDDELFLVEKIIPRTGVLHFGRLTLRVSRLDEEARKWVVVTDLGERVLFIHYGHLGNVCCSAKELPDGCGLSGDSVVFTDEPGNVTYSYKYGVDTGRAEDDLNFWRYSRENRVTILSSYPVVTLRVEP